MNETKLKERIKELEKDRDLLQEQFLTIYDPYNDMVKPIMNNAQIKQIMHANDLAIAEVKRLRSVVADIESMIPDNHEEVSPILTDILSECHTALPRFALNPKFRGVII